MVVEVACSTGRTPRQVRREESIRTLFLTWLLGESGRLRPLQLLLEQFSGVSAGAPPGGRASEASQRVLDAARSAEGPDPGKRRSAAIRAAREAARRKNGYSDAQQARADALRNRIPNGGVSTGNGARAFHIDDIAGARSVVSGAYGDAEARRRFKG